ncbi:MAG: TOBE domain-containing protein [Cytophagales bacterium]|nr:TOBE domain-containing protein [Cytophagales bacterium]
MNRFSGKISKIEVNGSLSLVTVAASERITIKTIIIETPETAAYLKIGNTIQVLFKETEVVLGLNQKQAISLQNRINGTIIQIEKGALLSKVVIDTEIGSLVSVVSTEAIKELNLEENQEVIAMIKLNEIMLSE